MPSRYLNPATDTILLSLKGIATKGSARGPIHDRGVLAVIHAIESNGYFVPGEIGGLLNLLRLHQETNAPVLTAEDNTEARRFLAQQNWTLDEGFQYAAGAAYAESIFAARYGKKKDK